MFSAVKYFCIVYNIDILNKDHHAIGGYFLTVPSQFL